MKERDYPSQPSPIDLQLLTAKELADLLRTSTRAIYQMVQRNQVPGVIRLGRRRLLFDRAAVLRWINERRAPSLRGGTDNCDEHKDPPL